MRKVRFVKDHGEHRAEAVVELDDQEALDAVVGGHAVNAEHEDAVALTTRSLGGAPENKAAEGAQ
jgi:hypothetical protein